MRARALLLSVSLLVLLGYEATRFRRWELKRRVLLLPRVAGLTVESAELEGSLYEFDREYGRFLDGVRRLVPPGSSVGLSIPPSSVQYVYTAHYALAPRTVFPTPDGAHADFLAVYDPIATRPPPGARRVPGGFVRSLR